MVELTDEEYKLFKQDHCDHEPEDGQTSCYCCGGFDYYTCKKCDFQVSRECPSHIDSDCAPYCRNCI